MYFSQKYGEILGLLAGKFMLCWYLFSVTCLAFLFSYCDMMLLCQSPAWSASPIFSLNPRLQLWNWIQNGFRTYCSFTITIVVIIKDLEIIFYIKDFFKDWICWPILMCMTWLLQKMKSNLIFAHMDRLLKEFQHPSFPLSFPAVLSLPPSVMGLGSIFSRIMWKLSLAFRPVILMSFKEFCNY